MSDLNARVHRALRRAGRPKSYSSCWCKAGQALDQFLSENSFICTLESFGTNDWYCELTGIVNVQVEAVSGAEAICLAIAEAGERMPP